MHPAKGRIMDAAMTHDTAENKDLRKEPSKVINSIDNAGREESGSLPCVSNIVTFDVNEFDVNEEPFVLFTRSSNDESVLRERQNCECFFAEKETWFAHFHENNRLPYRLLVHYLHVTGRRPMGAPPRLLVGGDRKCANFFMLGEPPEFWLNRGTQRDCKGSVPPPKILGSILACLPHALGDVLR